MQGGWTAVARCLIRRKNAAVIEHRDAIGDLEEARIMGDDDHRPPSSMSEVPQ